MIVRDQAELRRYVHAFVAPGAATAILDLGCGHGADLVELGRSVGEEALLVGIDASEKSIEAARELSDGDARYRFQAADVSERLPFEDESFDRVLSVNLLECVPDKQQLLSEVHRVLRPGGRVVFGHFDWDSQVIDGDDKDLVRMIVHLFADWKQRWMADADGWMGRRLWRTFQESGLFEGSVEAVMLANTSYEEGQYGWESIRDYGALVRRGTISAEQYERFRRSVEGLAARNAFFYGITMFIYTGSRALDARQKPVAKL